MFAIILFSFLAFIHVTFADPSSGCKKRAGVEDIFEAPPSELTFEGRHIRLIFPPKYKIFKASPLILAYSDRGMDTREFSKLTAFDHPELNNNAIIAFVSPKSDYWITDPQSTWDPEDISFDSDGTDPANDLDYTRVLLNHLERTFCLNTQRIYAVGLGTGGGVVHQLACHTHLSRRIAAFAPINGAFYRPRGSEAEDLLWGKCMIGRRPIPMLEIHGVENGEYLLKPEMEHARSLEVLSAEEWVNDWRALNNCGEDVGETVESGASRAVRMTQLQGGQRSESVTYGGLARKVSYRCGYWSNRNNSDFKTEEKDGRKINLLHYAVERFMHGWPRMKGPVQEEVEFYGNKVKPLGAPNFDASVVVLEFFRQHKLPPYGVIQGQAKRLLIERGAKVYKDGPSVKDAKSMRDSAKAAKAAKDTEDTQDTKKDRKGAYKKGTANDVKKAEKKDHKSTRKDEL
ncbi:hypothetical protein BT63DRAFT_474857 [Microthyrium microscopicum]|uniref:feruloyl esterase n=1 Tax=Microthyrium microscopicum TaxID=703497 RepID=A0A6A6USW2_9PEZI|nr:hypothetical protein BT63DRAFT_474857 [Microthyrium microscopicum]